MMKTNIQFVLLLLFHSSAYEIVFIMSMLFICFWTPNWRKSCLFS